MQEIIEFFGSLFGDAQKISVAISALAASLVAYRGIYRLVGIFFTVLGGVIGEYKERKQKRANKNETEPKKAVSTKEKNTSRCIKYKIQGKEYTKEEIGEITQKSYLQEKNIFKEYNNQKTYEKK